MQVRPGFCSYLGHNCRKQQEVGTECLGILEDASRYLSGKSKSKNTRFLNLKKGSKTSRGTENSHNTTVIFCLKDPRSL